MSVDEKFEKLLRENPMGRAVALGVHASSLPKKKPSGSRQVHESALKAVVLANKWRRQIDAEQDEDKRQKLFDNAVKSIAQSVCDNEPISPVEFRQLCIDATRIESRVNAAKAKEQEPDAYFKSAAKIFDVASLFGPPNFKVGAKSAALLREGVGCLTIQKSYPILPRI